MKAKLETSSAEESENKFFSYPAHKVLGVFDDPNSIKNALNQLKLQGFKETDIEVINNAGQIDFSGEEHGFWGRIVRSLQHLGTEGRYLDRYEQELKDGHLVLTVTAKNLETKQKVKDILQSNGGHRLTYFGNWVIESMAETNTNKSNISSYGNRRKLETSFDETLVRTREELKKEGFGVLTEINMKEKLKEKIGKEFRKYIILGACNPSLAYAALQEDLDIGLLLPCNVIVYETDGGSIVAAIDAAKMLSVAENPKLEETAKTVNEKLKRAINSI